MRTWDPWTSCPHTPTSRHILDGTNCGQANDGMTGPFLGKGAGGTHWTQ